jgi:ribosomal protein L5
MRKSFPKNLRFSRLTEKLEQLTGQKPQHTRGNKANLG